MRTPKLLALLVISLLPLFIACEASERAEITEQGEAAPQATEQEMPGAGQPNDLNPVEAQIMIDDVTIGHEVGVDGLIAAEDQGDDFAPGDPIFLTMKVEDAPAGATVKVVWYGPGELKVKEEQKTVNEAGEMLTFEAANTGSWQTGDYRAEIWIGDEKVNQQQFQIVTDRQEAGR
jgi:hypothetical protein